MATSNSDFLKYAAEYLQKTLPQLSVYSEDARAVIQEQILQCMEAYRGLSMSLPKHPPDHGNESEGEKVLMFVLDGTIPITYQGGHYNIPVSVRLAGGYPLNPPVGYVKSSGELQLKQNHVHVDRTGVCRIKGFLAEQWDGSRTLKDFVDEMVKVFSVDPPLYSKAAAPLAPSAPISDMHPMKPRAGNPPDSGAGTPKDGGVPIRRKTKSGGKKRPHGHQQAHQQQQQPVPNPPFPSQTKGSIKSVLVSEQPPAAPHARGTREGREKSLNPEWPQAEIASDVSTLSARLSSISVNDHKRDDAVQNVAADLRKGRIAMERGVKVDGKVRQQRKEKEDAGRRQERPDQNHQRIAQYPPAHSMRSSPPILHAQFQDASIPPKQQQYMPSNVVGHQWVATHPHPSPVPQQGQQQQPPLSPYLQPQPNVAVSMQVPSSQPLPSQQVSPQLPQRQHQPSPSYSQPPPLMLPQTHQQVQEQRPPMVLQRAHPPQMVAQQGQQPQQPQSSPVHSQAPRASPQPFSGMQFANQLQPGQPRQSGPQPPPAVYMVGPQAQQPEGQAVYLSDPRNLPQQYGQEPPRSQPSVQDQPSTWPPYSPEQVQPLQAPQSRVVFQERPVYGHDITQAHQQGAQQRLPHMPEHHLPQSQSADQQLQHQQQQQQPQQPLPQSPQVSSPAISIPVQIPELPTGPRQRAAPPTQHQRPSQPPMSSLGQTFSGVNDQSPVPPPMPKPPPQYGPFLPHQYPQSSAQQAQPQLQPAASQPLQQGRPIPQQMQQRAPAGMPGRWSPVAAGVYSSQSMAVPAVQPPTSAAMFTRTPYAGQTPASPTVSPVIPSSSSASVGGADGPPLANGHMPQVTSPQATPVVMSPVTFQQAAQVPAAATPYTFRRGGQRTGSPMYMNVPPLYSISPTIPYSPGANNLYSAFVQSPRGGLAPYNMPHMSGGQPGAYRAYSPNHTPLPHAYSPYNQQQPVGQLPQSTPPSQPMQPGHYSQYASPYQPAWRQASPPYQGEGPRWG